MSSASIKCTIKNVIRYCFQNGKDDIYTMDFKQCRKLHVK